MRSIIKNVLVLLFVVCGLSLQAQTDDHKTTLKFSPVQFGRSYFELGLEISLNDGRSSLQLSPMALLKKSDFEEFSGIQFELQYRSYIKKLSMEETPTWIFTDIDFFAGAYALGLTYTEDSPISWYDPERNMEFRETLTQDIFAAEGGVFVGVKFILGERVTLELLAGGGVRYSDVSDNSEQLNNTIPDYYYYNDNTNDVFDLGYYGVKPRLNLQIGITL